ncbi:MAG: hypothetical protein QOD41_1584 [Cryptosporangiaceae bacterium]|nr:hypothetical protein [Cryptosporangiaceae bacterium]
MGMRLRNLAFVSLVLIAACASPKGSGGSDTAGPASSPSPSPSAVPGAEMPAVKVARSGGIAGFKDEYTVNPDGSLTGKTRAKPSIAATLSAAQLSELKSLVNSDSLAAEAAKSPIGPKNCADGFIYSVNAGKATVSGTDCGGLATAAPTMWKIVQIVRTAAGG